MPAGKRSKPLVRSAPAARRTIADALFSRTQQRVLSLVFGQSNRQFRLVELIQLAGSGRGAVQREVQRLVDSGLVTCTQSGRDKTYQANRQSAIYDELRGIVEKTTGVPSVLQSALASISDRVRFAILYGSVAKQTDKATSDIDILIVSDELTLEDVFDALSRAEQRLGRPVSPTLYTSEEFKRGRHESSPFLTKVLGGKHVVLVGSEDAVLSAR